MLITLHEDQACQVENYFVFPKLFIANFCLVMKIRRNIALCSGKMMQSASENLHKLLHKSAMKFGKNN